MSRLVCTAAAWAAVASILSPAFAQGTADPAANAEPAFRLPDDPRLWHNSPPLSLESLSGKGVVFYFFDEECPRCVAGWEPVQSLAASYRDKPVLFVAVNSGTDPREIRRYLSRNRVTMPVIHDPTRALENAMGVPQLSLDGPTYALRYVAGDGSTGVANGAGGAAFANAAQAALKGAEWRVDPAGIHPRMLDAWRAIELGDYASAARTVTRAAASEAGPIHDSAAKLLEAVEEEAAAALESAQEAAGAGDDWAAYEAYQSLTERFGDYDTLATVEKARTQAERLAKTDEIKDEIAAAKMLQSALARGSVPNLKRIGARYPETEAATRAAEMLASRGR